MSDQVPRQPQQPQAPLGPYPRCTRCGEPQEDEPEFGGYICWPCHFAGLEDPNHPCPRFGHPQVLDQDTGEYWCRRCRDAWAEEPQAPPRGQIPQCPRCQQPQRFYNGLGVYACEVCTMARDLQGPQAIPVCQVPGCESYPLDFDQFGQPHCFYCDLRARQAAQQVPNPPANDQVVEEWPQFVPQPRNPPQAAAPAPNQAPLNRQGQRPAGNVPPQVNQNPIQDHREQDPDDPSSDEFVPWTPQTPESFRKTWIQLFGDPYLDSDPDAPMESPPRMPAPMEHQAPPGPNQVLLNRQSQRPAGNSPRQVNQNLIQHPQVQDSEDSMSENDWGYFGDDEEEYPGAPMQSRPRRHVPMERRQAPHRPNQVLLNRQGPRQVGNAPQQAFQIPTQFPQVRNPGAAVQSRPQMPPPRNPPQATAHRQTSPERNQVLLNRQGQLPTENSPRQAHQNPTQFPQVRNHGTAMQVRPQIPAPSDRNSPNRAPSENSSPIPRAQNPMGQEYSAQPMIMDPRLYRTHPCIRCGMLQDYNELARKYECSYCEGLGLPQERPPVAQGPAPGAPYLDHNMDPDDQSSQDSPGNSPDSRRGRY